MSPRLEAPGAPEGRVLVFLTKNAPFERSGAAEVSSPPSARALGAVPQMLCVGDEVGVDIVVGHGVPFVALGLKLHVHMIDGVPL